MCRFRLHICNWMHVCILNVSWSVSISAGTRAPGRSRARAQGQGARGAGGRPVASPAGRARVRVISSREQVAGAQGRISHRADCAYRLQYSETRDTPHTPFACGARAPSAFFFGCSARFAAGPAVTLPQPRCWPALDHEPPLYYPLGSATSSPAPKLR